MLLAGRQVAFGSLHEVMTKENISIAYGGSIPADSAGLTFYKLAEEDSKISDSKSDFPQISKITEV